MPASEPVIRQQHVVSGLGITLDFTGHRRQSNRRIQVTIGAWLSGSLRLRPSVLTLRSSPRTKIMLHVTTTPLPGSQYSFRGDGPNWLIRPSPFGVVVVQTVVHYALPQIPW